MSDMIEKHQMFSGKNRMPSFSGRYNGHHPRYSCTVTVAELLIVHGSFTAFKMLNVVFDLFQLEIYLDKRKGYTNA